MTLDTTISFAQIGTAILLVALVLLQQRGASLGSAFAGDSGSFYAARRGIQKHLYRGTIILSILFIALALARLFLNA